MAERVSHILRTDCILRMPKAPSVEYGVRMSVMSRHTLNDGMTLDGRLHGRWDDHRPQLGPPLKLIGAYYRDPNPSWEEFAQKYCDHLTGTEQRTALDDILLLLHTVNVTLLCIEETPEKCHRRLLGEMLGSMEEGLQMQIY